MAPGAVQIRPLGPEDVDTLTELALSFHTEDGHPLRDVDRKALAAICYGDPMARGWLIEADGARVGYVVLTLGFSIEYGGRDGFIDDLYLISEVRNQGVGEQVMELVEAEAQALGVNALHLEVGTENTRAQALYRKRGFAESGRLLMSKRLS